MKETFTDIVPAGFSVKNMTKEFLSREGTLVKALDGVSFESPAQGITCLVGPTGSGKSTVLRIIAGLEAPDEGTVLIEGRKPADLICRIGFLTQGSSLFPWMTVAENIGIGLKLCGKSRENCRDQVQELCSQLGLPGSQNRYPYELSGGMQQRAALGRLLASAARYWLMDEPFTSLDEHSRQQLREILLKLAAERGLAVLFVTHSIDEAVYLADRVVVLSAAPGSTVKTVHIDMPHPRDRVSLEYSRIVEQVRTSIEAIL
jgi:NitT/TauT family transport system ATP-binding protein